VLGDIPAERLTAALVADVFTRIETRNAAIEAGEVEGKTVGATTQVHIHGVIRAGLRWAVKQRKLMFDPSSGVELARAQRRKAVVYDAEQTKMFLAHTADDRLAVLYRLVLVRGLRRGEAVGLRWANVDLGGKRIRIAETVLQLGGKVTPGLPKTDAGERWVSLDAATVEALRMHRKRQAQERLAAGEAYQDSGLVFAREDGTPLRPNQVTKRFQALAKDAGLPVIRLHDGRHSAATLGLSAGIDIKIVSDLLGHSTSAITRDLYTHVLPAVHDDAAERMAELIALPKRDVETAGEADSV
jgi:integrase